MGTNVVVASQRFSQDVSRRVVRADTVHAVWFTQRCTHFGDAFLREDGFLLERVIHESIDVSVHNRCDANVEHQAITETVLQVLNTADATQATADHNTHTSTQRFTLFHAVGRQQDCRLFAARRDVSNHIPHEAARHWIHPSRWFIQEDNRWRSDHGDGNRQLALVTTTQSTSQFVFKVVQVHLLHLVLDSGVNIFIWHTLDCRKEFQVFTHSQQINQSIELRAVTD
ncbi:hypothetical protein AC1031_021991 [Aphanomyces cochlioides]|nr:hypothetical protein AC1031_021991 [Aphanomyces cochlioides]